MSYELERIGISKLLNHLTSKYKTKQNAKKEYKGTVLFEASNQYVPIGNYYSLIYLKTFMEIGFKVDLFCSNKNTPGYKIFRFIAQNTIFFKNALQMFIFLPKIFIQHFRNISSYFSIEKLFFLEIDGIYIGDIVYDEYLRDYHEGTVKRINLRYLKKLTEAYYLMFLIKGIYKKNRYEYVLVNHHCYIRQVLMIRIALKLNIKVLIIASTCIKKIDQSNVKYLMDRPNPYIFNKCKQDDRVMKKLFDTNVSFSMEDYLAVTMGFLNNTDMHTNEEFSMFKKQLDTSKSKNLKIVVVAAHCFVDNVTGADGRTSFFRDYFIWLDETVRRSVLNKNILVVLKKHPQEYKISSKVSSDDVFDKYKNESNIIKCPNNLKISQFSEYVDTVITSRGSVGNELSQLGIPVLIGGNGNAIYSGFDFAIEPKDRSDYFQFIDNIHLIDKLNDSQILNSMIYKQLYEKTLHHKLPNSGCEYTREDCFENPTVFHWTSTQGDSGVYSINAYDKLITKLEFFEKNCMDKMTRDIVEFLADTDCYTLSEYLFKKDVEMKYGK